MEPRNVSGYVKSRRWWTMWWAFCETTWSWVEINAWFHTVSAIWNVRHTWKTPIPVSFFQCLFIFNIYMLLLRGLNFHLQWNVSGMTCSEKNTLPRKNVFPLESIQSKPLRKDLLCLTSGMVFPNRVYCAYLTNCSWHKDFRNTEKKSRSWASIFRNTHEHTCAPIQTLWSEQYSSWIQECDYTFFLFILDRVNGEWWQL